MASLDTNVLVRYLTQDDEAQFTIANQVIHHFDTSVFIPITVILELKWVLRSRYKFGKDKIIGTINKLLSIESVTIANEESLEMALLLFAENPADFADCPHTALTQSAQQSPLLTFDKDASKLAGNQLL